MKSPAVRHRADLCPGVLRPWPAEDGALVRLRLVGGRVEPDALVGLLRVAESHGDGTVHLTKRANLQLRGLPADGDCLAPELVEEIAATGLLPFPSHELVRNIMVSPLSGLDSPLARDLQSPGDSESRARGRADLRPVARELDEGLCAHPSLAALPGRFLFVLDDGRGDLLDRSLDLGLVAVSSSECQLRMGTRAWGPVVPLEEAAGRLVGLARAFITVRGEGPTAAWHVDELPARTDDHPRDPRIEVPNAPPPYGVVAPGVAHVTVPDGVLTREQLDDLLADEPDHLVVTPWRSVVVVDRVV
ncbi:nitrite reductase [Nocardioides sp. JQ2195]|uniref:nitrite reductase n=1 Tax=Nocardioides sp. JQ2195 TaxID=2592334 RepID=UPI00143E5253|nr:nitrite reductase [Nocardioides sp. JQ2195]QIX27736.1 nitrite reductase [Nocardioides sp. JQ2195]